MADNLDILHRQNEFIARAKFSLKHENVEGLLNEKELVIFRFSITAREVNILFAIYNSIELNFLANNAKIKCLQLIPYHTSHCFAFLPWFCDSLSEGANCIIVTHVLEADPIDLQNHVPRLDPPILGHCPPVVYRTGGHELSSHSNIQNRWT